MFLWFYNERLDFCSEVYCGWIVGRWFFFCWTLVCINFKVSLFLIVIRYFFKDINFGFLLVFWRICRGFFFWKGWGECFLDVFYDLGRGVVCFGFFIVFDFFRCKWVCVSGVLFVFRLYWIFFRGVFVFI